MTANYTINPANLLRRANQVNEATKRAPMRQIEMRYSPDKLLGVYEITTTNGRYNFTGLGNSPEEAMANLLHEISIPF